MPAYVACACDLNTEVVNLTEWLISLALLLESFRIISRAEEIVNSNKAAGSAALTKYPLRAF